MSRTLISFVCAASLALPAALACGDGTSPEPSEPVCNSISPDLIRGTPPQFTWTPTCRLSFLVLTDYSADTIVWGVVSARANAILPPVIYGVRPRGATELAPPGVLEPGKTYRLALGRYTRLQLEPYDTFALVFFAP